MVRGYGPAVARHSSRHPVAGGGTGGLGPESAALLTAVADGLVVRAPDDRSIMGRWVLDDQPLGTNQVRSLVRRGLIDAGLGMQAARITEDGQRALRQWADRSVG